MDDKSLYYRPKKASGSGLIDPLVTIEDILPDEIRWVVSQGTSANSYIIEPVSSRQGINFGLDKCSIIQQSSSLDEAQLRYLSETILDPTSYYSKPVLFRRFPSFYFFVVRIFHQKQYLDVMMDTANAGWEFWHNSGIGAPLNVTAWNRVGFEMRRLAQLLFPEISTSFFVRKWRPHQIDWFYKELNVNHYNGNTKDTLCS